MKRLFALFLLLMLLPSLAFAQQACLDATRISVFWDQAPAQAGQKPIDHTNLFRSDVACGLNGTFAVVHSGPPNVLTFVDTNVIAGNTYCYVAFNFGADGTGSAPSNTAECTVPLGPVPPAQNLRFVP